MVRFCKQYFWFMRIVHISDLHVSRNFKRNNIKKFKVLLKHALKLEFDHLVITGDLSDGAHEIDFQLIRKILKNNDLLDSSRTSIVIGNHDIFGGVQTAADVLEFPKKCKSVDYEVKVSNFISYFEELFTDCHFVSPQKFFPYYKNVGELGIVGINSIAHYSKIGNPLASTGKVYSEQLNDLSKLILNKNIKNQPRLALVHHHFYKKSMDATSPQSSVWKKIESYTLRLRNKKKIINTFKDNGIRLVLHGHSHEVKEYSRKGLHFLNAGGSIESEPENLSFFTIDYKDGIFETSTEIIPWKVQQEPQLVC